MRRGDDLFPNKEVVIHAGSWEMAQRALSLIQACMLLATGEPALWDPDEHIAHNDDEPEWLPEERRALLAGRYVSTSGFPFACSIAAKASRRLKRVYAISKYKFSVSLYSVHHVDLEPYRSQHLPVSQFPGDHVMFSYAIISAYSALEDVGLELRASAKRPSRVNGEWNLVVREELEGRLKRSGVDLSETILWTVRGPARKTELKRAISCVERAPWSAGPMVRDCELEIVDAIAYADWLRDCVASHGVKDLTKVLSPYDVINVQHLTRRLLLETLGYWRWQPHRNLDDRQARVATKVPSTNLDLRLKLVSCPDRNRLGQAAAVPGFSRCPSVQGAMGTVFVERGSSAASAVREPEGSSWRFVGKQQLDAHASFRLSFAAFVSRCNGLGSLPRSIIAYMWSALALMCSFISFVSASMSAMRQARLRSRLAWAAVQGGSDAADPGGSAAP